MVRDCGEQLRLYCTYKEVEGWSVLGCVVVAGTHFTDGEKRRGRLCIGLVGLRSARRVDPALRTCFLGVTQDPGLHHPTCCALR